jgi:hypothetical protein
VISKELSALVDALAHRPWTDTAECERRKAALLAKISEIERDAQRYRWLRNQVEDYEGHATFPDVAYVIPIPDKAGFNAVDDAIDAAREVPRE